MSDTTRTVLIALGVALIVVALVPLLAATGMMGGGMMGWTMGGVSRQPGARSGSAGRAETASSLSGRAQPRSN